MTATLIALAAAILLPGGRTVEENPRLPWDLRLDSQGNLSVFGLVLGKSNLVRPAKVSSHRVRPASF